MDSFIHWYVNNYELFMQKLKDEQDKLPYNINILDEIHTDENAHSRILVKILKYSQHGDYRFLRLFLKHLGDPLDKLECMHPVITAEKGRIDARICEEGRYTIIIENKIHGAVDQDNQINRYIENEVARGYRLDNNIYVLYLTNEGGSPSDNSLKTEYKMLLGNKYKEITYREHILKWLWDLLGNEVNTLLMNKKDRDVIISAITQYANYLHGLFHEREGEKEMEEEMMKYLKKKLGLNDEPLENIKDLETIEDHLNTASEMQRLIEAIKKETYQSIYNPLRKVVKKIKKKGYEVYIDNRFGEHDYLLTFSPHDWKDSYCIGISFDGDLGKLYYGIYSNHGERLLIEEENEIKRCLDVNGNSNNWWVFWKYFDSPYDNFLTNYVEVLKRIENGNMVRDIWEKVKNILQNKAVQKVLRR